MLHSRNRPRPVVHQQHQTVFCSSMPEVQPNDHHRATLAAYGVQDWEYTLRTIAVEAEHRTFVGDKLRGPGRVAVKRPMSSGHGTDAQSVPAKAQVYRPYPVICKHISVF